ncbi:MAG TPA: 30S ribosome-binding factor RbfA [Flavipsychrobacter sp.]|nr:30S ribosome-binding factor RbfA [Flavipsychrobacter sp.]
MEETKRQRQVAKLVMEELSDIFQKEGINVIDGGMVSISKVSLTPDLLEARVHLSLFQIKNPEELMGSIRERTKEFRNQLGMRVRNQLRRVPDLHFFVDDTLGYVDKMETLFKQIREEREAKESGKKEGSADQ